jgi:hypothetical protein
MDAALQFLRHGMLNCALIAAALGAVSVAHASGDRTKLIYSFCSQSACADGTNPEGSLIEDPSGNLYGTTEEGGAQN